MKKIACLLCVSVLWACGGDTKTIIVQSDSDASTGRNRDASGCISDLECSDGLFCNGAELCDPAADDADALGCVAARLMPECDDAIACTTDVCSDALNRCDFRAVDGDGDGHADIGCEDSEGEALGDDCDDNDANRYPGNTEVCDFDAHDEDCDNTTVGNRDRDGDGEVDAECCNGEGNDAVCGTDCNDLSIAQRSMQPEFCDGLDNNCDGMIDNETRQVDWYADGDQDNFGDVNAAPVRSCDPVDGASVLGTDCNDEKIGQHPAQLEICDYEDNDCDGVIDEAPFCEGGGVIIPDGGVSGTGGTSGEGGTSGTGGTGGMSGTGGTGGTAGNAGSGGTGGTGGTGGSAGNAGSGGTGGGGTGGTGGGCAGAGDPEWTPIVTTTPNCAANVFGTYLLRKDGYLLYQSGSQQIPILDPQAVPISDWVEAFAGDVHGCGLREGGEVWCWGLNASADGSGQLGDGTLGGTTALYRASRVLKGAGDPLTGIVHLATGQFAPNASCAIDGDGKVWCWGERLYLAGNAQAVAYATPIKVDATTDLDRVQHMVFSSQHACVIRLDECDQREVWCWGSNSYGQVGTGNRNSPIQYPTKVEGLTDPSTLAMAYVDATCVIDGTRVKCWGHNWQGATGTGAKTNDDTLAPSFVREMDGSFLDNIVQIVGGSNDICALDSSGAMWCWGYNHQGYAAPYTQSMVAVTGVEAMGLSNLQSGNAPRYLTSDGNYHLGATVRAPDCNALQ